ncbi:MAG: PKD domain-containing protein [Sandaracinaceae bacterium]
MVGRTLSVSAVVTALTLALPATGQTQDNIAPRARVSADRTEIAPGDTVEFRGSDSFDPDDGPAALSFEWDFGDEATDSEANPRHVFTAPGVYVVQLTVRDGESQAIASLTVHVLSAPTDSPPTHSAPLWIDAARDWVWAVHPDGGSVSITDVQVGRVLSVVATGGRPVSLVGRGERVFVVDREGGRVLSLDASRFTVEGEARVGHLPFGIALVPGSADLLVALEGEDAVVRIDDALLEVQARYEVADGPRALAVTHDGAEAYVTHFITRGSQARLTRIDLASGTPTAVSLAVDPGPDQATSGRGVPNLLGAITIEPSGERLWVGGLKSNSGRGSFLTGEPFPFTNRVRALLAPVDILGEPVDRVDRRIDPNDSDSVSAVVFSPTGRHAFVTHPGAGILTVYDMSAARLVQRGGSADTVPFLARVELGHVPHGVVLSDDASRLYVLEELSRDLVILDVSDPATPTVEMTVPLIEEPFSAEVALGQRMFHRSRAPLHSGDNYIACASCHPGGGHDGQTWDFTQFGEGLRNTIDLRGRSGMGHGRVHWSGNFDEIQDFENDIVHGFSGTGLAQDGAEPNPPMGALNAGRSPELDALARYVASLGTPPPSPFRDPDGHLTDAAVRGRAVFTGAGCGECHVRPRYTDSEVDSDVGTHDVGTLLPSSGQRLGAPLAGIDTPTLLGLWDGAPYLHDGRATLREVLTSENTGDAHGRTSTLVASQLDDLEAYLRSLDGRPEIEAPLADAGVVDAGTGSADAGDAPVASPGCGCRVGGTPPATEFSGWWLLGALLFRRDRWMTWMGRLR